MRLKNIFLRSSSFWLFCLCALLFAWNEKEAFTLKRTVGELSLAVGLTPIQRVCLFDYPKMMASVNDVIVKYNIRSEKELSTLPRAGQKEFRAAEEIPVWNGLVVEVAQGVFPGSDLYKIPLFEKIREGQVWRLFTPSLLHKDIIHLVFNMGWLFLLGLQIECRMSKCRFLLLVFLLGVFSNTAQYLMGGPYFLGFSGVVVGLTGFIWARQRKAPEEGYPLPKTTALFVFYFVLVMMGLEGIAVAAQAVFSTSIPFNIANTAHVAGGLAGLLLGRCVFFSRRVR